jgi:type II secretory pathway predicted ATPase ExeA/predicted transcriptional regulator
MEREYYYRKLNWRKSPFIKSTSLDIPIIGRMDEYEELSECIHGWDRIIVMTAPIGYGKTTFMNQLVINKPRGIRFVVAFNAYEPPEAVMNRIKNELPLTKRLFFHSDKTRFAEVLQARLGQDNMLLIFDEAQDYDADLFKWLRILNDRADNVFMVFLGLQGLEDKITSEASFRDRKSKSIKLNPFEIEDLEEIIKERIEWAGGKGIRPFTDDGLKRLCESANHVPRLLLENAQKVLEEVAHKELEVVDATFVENVLGFADQVEKKPQGGKEDSTDEGMGEVYEVKEAISVEKTSHTAPTEALSFMDELSPTQRDIVEMLLAHESLSISELGDVLKKDIRSIGSLIRKLRGLNRMEVVRKPKVPYPVIVRKGKEVRMGRQQYVYSLSDNSRRLLANR